MSHNFRRPPPLCPLARRQERQLTMMGGTIGDQETLDRLLEGATPVMREALMEMVMPFLGFIPDEALPAATPDCPVCGLKRGSVIGHQCLDLN